jgi:hypothetical protein
VLQLFLELTPVFVELFVDVVEPLSVDADCVVCEVAESVDVTEGVVSIPKASTSVVVAVVVELSPTKAVLLEPIFDFTFA